MALHKIGPAAARLNKSVSRLRELERSGKISAIRLADGTRLFTDEELDRYAAAERDRKQKPFDHSATA